MFTFEDKVQEILEAALQRGEEYIKDWVDFSNEMVGVLEKGTLEEYDKWRMSTGGCISCMPMWKRRGETKETLMPKLIEARLVALAAEKKFKETLSDCKNKTI